jgi:phosphate transport system substrate-binding protein
LAGKIKNWQEVGGSDAPIHLFTRDEASGTRETFWEKLLKKGPIDAKANIVASYQRSFPHGHNER